MAGLLDFLRRIAPGDAPVDPMAGSVMSRGYIPETSGKQLSLGGIRGLLDVSPVGLADAATQAINRANVPSLVALRAVTGKQTAPGDAMVGLLGQGGGAGYDAARSATQAVVPMMGLLGNQARGALPAGYARDQSGAIVWHGSPHKFDKFDSSKIGTGEGAQAYGHGLYLAESPVVAKEYRDKLSKNVTVDGSKLQSIPSDGPLAQAHNMVVRNVQNGMTPDAAISATKKYWADAANEMLAFAKNSPELASRIQQEALSRMKVSEAAATLKPQSFYRDPGYLYKVDLPDDAIARMLDWDKPLSQQPEAVRAAAAKRMSEIKALGGNPPADPSGQWLHRAFHPQAWEQGFGQSLAADRLREAGIPGIRYLDGVSRNAGAGTSNYVVFPGNEGLLKILERR